jgi:hypothetical protein
MPEGKLYYGIFIACYCGVFALSWCFAFRLKLFRDIEDILSFVLISSHRVTPLDLSYTWFDDWLISRHKTVGVLLAAASAYVLYTLVSLLFW